ncbi:MAG: DUF4065 domain-containing protein [Firmicutes bacterium]|nr:DUF4065 domain-containing protein [Bacillota bacterium]
MKCDICGSSNTYIKNYKHQYIIKGKTIEFESDRRFCEECNSAVYDNLLDNVSSEKAIDVYNKKYGIPKEKIIELRSKYNLSQNLFAKIIGCAKKTLISYEKGSSIPNDNYIIILNSLLCNPLLIINLIESNKGQFTQKEYLKLQDKIIQNNNINQLFFDADFEPTVYNGYTRLNKDKVLNMILYFSQGFVLKTKLLKEMFYADFLYYKNTGASITGLEYAKITHGPVPDNFDEIISTYVEQGLINYKIEYEKDYENHKISSKYNFDKKLFLIDELETLEKIKNYFKLFTSKEIADFSHNEKAFLETEFGKKIEYDYAFDIVL